MIEYKLRLTPIWGLSNAPGVCHLNVQPIRLLIPSSITQVGRCFTVYISEHEDAGMMGLSR
jgi:hypothetical protein